MRLTTFSGAAVRAPTNSSNEEMLLKENVKKQVRLGVQLAINVKDSEYADVGRWT
jgi:hypothetical protein